MKNRLLTTLLFVCAMLKATGTAEPINDLSALKDHNYARGIYFTDQTFLRELLKQINRSNARPRRYIHAVLKMFTTVVKGTDCVTTDSFIETLQFLNDFLTPFMSDRDYESYIQIAMNRELETYQRLKEFNSILLLHSFQTSYDEFQLNPVQFLQNLGDVMAQAAQEELELQKLRATLKLFLELHLNKLFWAFEDNEGCWEQVKVIAYQLTLLFENNVFDDLNDLDDLFWSLIHRFGHFFEYAYKNCSFSLFEAIKQDLAHGSLLLLDLAEQDTCIEKRSECLLHIVLHAEARKRAHDLNLVHGS